MTKLCTTCGLCLSVCTQNFLGNGKTLSTHTAALGSEQYSKNNSTSGTVSGTHSGKIAR
ncbi:hypothetical protein DPMN_050183 [Dreissena polymorpha]|uniref:4Fe-4S ferredoxin-type domain-containing protein n=1 Tax=Dreissena polymorpha TaxID=45954 RepID=A0A9D4CG99_DREPO|nr:hypothetical protein DPMN_050183 [Dreissena polymorpha]